MIPQKASKTKKSTQIHQITDNSQKAHAKETHQLNKPIYSHDCIYSASHTPFRFVIGFFCTLRFFSTKQKDKKN